MANRSWRNPGENLPDLIVRQRSKLAPAQHSQNICRRSPTLQMPNQSEIDSAAPLDISFFRS
jgi:hypothetical protein